MYCYILPNSKYLNIVSRVYKHLCENVVTGLLEAPTDVSIEVGVDNMTLSWRPPFTLDGVSIYRYSVYIISPRHTKTESTTETHITLERPYSSTTYQISAWNGGGEGNTSIYGSTF